MHEAIIKLTYAHIWHYVTTIFSKEFLMLLKKLADFDEKEKKIAEGM